MRVCLVTVVGGEVLMLPHMLAHYRSLGIEQIVIHVNAQSCDDPIIERVRRTASIYSATIASVNIVPWFQFLNPLLYRQTLRHSSDAWFVIADQDELHEYPDSLSNIVAYCNQNNFDYVEGCFVDRVASDGILAEVEASVSLQEQFPLGACISGPILGAVINKVVLAKGSVKTSNGQHFAYSGRGCPVSQLYVPVHHFKWASGLIPRLEDRVQTYTMVDDMTKIESERFIAYYKKEGCIRVDDPRLMVSRCDPSYQGWSRLREWRLSSDYFRRF
jgi:hypothetical protein